MSIPTTPKLTVKMAALPPRAAATTYEALTDEEREVLHRHRGLMGRTAEVGFEKAEKRRADVLKQRARRSRLAAAKELRALQNGPHTLWKQHPHTGAWYRFTSASMLLKDAQRLWKQLPAGFEIRPIPEAPEAEVKA